MQRATLARAVERFAVAGEEAGLSVELMIQILNAGVSVETLLDLIDRSLQGRREQTGRSSGWVM
jgi:hypothetical protein